MYLIRNIGVAKFGRRDEAVGILKEMAAEMHKELGTPPARILTSSVGLSDSTVVMEMEYKSLAEFEEGLAKGNAWPGMQKYMQKLVDLAVPGSTRWEIYRIQS